MQFTKIKLSLSLTGLLALLINLPVYAQVGSSYQLSGDMVEFGDARDIKISPDNKYVVYRANQDDPSANELYSVRITGGVPVRLNADLVAGGNVNVDFKISADSKWVIYRADQDVEDSFKLYSVPITGGTPEQLSVDPLSNNYEGVSDFLISADSQRVVYRSNETFLDRVFLYSVPIGGGSQEQLNPFMDDGQLVNSDFLISADSQFVVYTADQNTDGVNEIFSVDIGGVTTAKQLNANLAAGGDVLDFKISADSARVVYRADQDEDGVFELYSVAIGDGTPEQLNPALTAGGDVFDFMISPDSQLVVYRADQDIDSTIELYSVPILGGMLKQLNKDPVVGGDVFASAGAPTFRISADSQRVIYRADQDVDGVFELYSVEIVGPNLPQQLNPELVTNGDVSSRGFQISADSQQVVYIADQVVDEVLELYSVPISGGPTTTLSDTLFDSSGEIADNFQISANSEHVIYLADNDFDEIFQLYRVPIVGGTPAQVNGDLVIDGNVDFGNDGFLLSSDDAFVVYIADQQVYEDEEVFARRLIADDFCMPIKSANGASAMICL